MTSLQRIFNTRLKKIVACCFCCNFSTLQQKPHDYICSGCKNMVSQKMYGFYWATLYCITITSSVHVLLGGLFFSSHHTSVLEPVTQYDHQSLITCSVYANFCFTIFSCNGTSCRPILYKTLMMHR